MTEQQCPQCSEQMISLNFEIPFNLCKQLQEIEQQRRTLYAAPCLKELLREAVEDFIKKNSDSKT